MVNFLQYIAKNPPELKTVGFSSISCAILEEIFKKMFSRKLILIASQLRLFEIIQSKIKLINGVQSWTTKKRPKTSN